MGNKLGIAYNIFDGEEILPFSLKNLRTHANYIVVVYQTTSNFGNINPTLKETLEKYKAEGLIDELIFYTPTIIKENNGEIDLDCGWINELRKRNIGLEKCIENGCSFFMCLDCDELYDPQQFINAFDVFKKDNYDISFTKVLTYYKFPTIQLTPPEQYYAPLFYKVREAVKFEIIEPYPVAIDGTRRMQMEKFKVFERKEIELHHYAYVRINLRSKVENSSARTDKVISEAVIHHYENWKEGKPAYMIGMQKYQLKEVENKFEIQL